MNGWIEAAAVVGVSAAAIAAAFPVARALRLDRLAAALHGGAFDPRTDIEEMCELAAILQRGGVIALERRLPRVDGKLLARGLSMLIDGLTPEKIVRALREEAALDSRRDALSWGRCIQLAQPLGILSATGAMALFLVGQLVGKSVAPWPVMFGTLAFSMLAIMLGSSGGELAATRRARNAMKAELAIAGVEALAKGADASAIRHTLESMLPPLGQMTFGVRAAA